MRSKLVSRLARLEAEFRREDAGTVIQIGLLRRLPNDFVGDRHVVVVRREKTGIPDWEGCEFEERPGPAPAGAGEPNAPIFLSEADLGL